MKTKLLGLLLLACGTIFAGGYYYSPAPVYAYGPPPAPIVEYRTPCPGPGYAWTSGYYYPVGRGYHWRAGYWVRPPYVGARWMAPRYYAHRYYRGYWRR